MEDLINIIKTHNPNININGRICHHRIKILYGLTEKYKLENYLEIGVHNGSSISYVLQSKYNKKCIGIDPFEDLKTDDPHMTHYQNKDKITMQKSLDNIQINNNYNSEINLIKDYSNKVNIKNINMDIDLLFIDGDHNYDAVKEDFYKFMPLVKRGGYIVFDDLHQDGPKKVFFEVLKNCSDVKLFGIYESTEGILIKV
jgi:predicted O-methyltransferase YrrM